MDLVTIGKILIGVGVLITLAGVFLWWRNQQLIIGD